MPLADWKTHKLRFLTQRLPYCWLLLHLRRRARIAVKVWLGSCYQSSLYAALGANRVSIRCSKRLFLAVKLEKSDAESILFIFALTICQNERDSF